MAKILPPDPSEFKRTQCGSCFVKVEYAPDEVKWSTDSDGDSYYRIECPRCKKTISVTSPISRLH